MLLLQLRKKDTLKEFERVLGFTGINISIDIMKDAINFGSLNNMRNLEITSAFDDGRLKAQDINDKDSFKVRKGKVGGYKNYMSSIDIDYIDSLIKNELNPFFGYC